jgi:hypothetical protein
MQHRLAFPAQLRLCPNLVKQPPTVQAITIATTTNSSARVISRSCSTFGEPSVPVQMRLMFGFGPNCDSFLGPEVLSAALKLLRPMLDAQVVPHHVADHRNEANDQKDINHAS